jgi:hypothetical protein
MLLSEWVTMNEITVVMNGRMVMKNGMMLEEEASSPYL